MTTRPQTKENLKPGFITRLMTTLRLKKATDAAKRTAKQFFLIQDDEAGSEYHNPMLGIQPEQRQEA
jgi:hypothetical protein